MYNILVFDELTMNFCLVYSSDSLKVIISMYNYYRKKFEDSYIKVVQEIQSNDIFLQEGV